MRYIKYTYLLSLIILVACATIPITTSKHKTISFFISMGVPSLTLKVPSELPDINYNSYLNRGMVPINANGFDYGMIMYYNPDTEDVIVSFIVCPNKHKVVAIVTPTNQWIYKDGIPVQVTLPEIQTMLELGGCSGEKT